MMDKILEDYCKIKNADDLITQAILCLELDNYSRAKAIAARILRESNVIEQRMVAMLIGTIAECEEPLITRAMLLEIYNIPGQRRSK